MWKHEGCSERQQDSASRCGHLDGHDIGTCEVRGRHKALKLFPKMQAEGVQPDSFTFVGVLNACASLVALEEGRSVHGQIVQVVMNQSLLWGIAWLTCMQNVGV
jgi:hypothetical protein